MGKQVADTSRKAYHEITAAGQIARQTNQGLRKIAESNQPITSRQLSKLTGLERTNCTRIIYDLLTAGLIEIAKKAPCPDTKKTVKWYKVVNNEQQTQLEA